MDAIFVAVSTGGTLAGIANYFRAIKPTTRIIAVDAAGSVALGDRPGPRLLTGIGAGRKSDFIGRGDYDEHFLVEDREAFSVCRSVNSSIGVSLGGSAGAVLAACLRYLSTHPEVATPVCLCADAGESYAQTIYDDAWLAAHGVQLQPQPLADLLEQSVQFELWRAPSRAA